MHAITGALHSFSPLFPLFGKMDKLYLNLSILFLLFLPPAFLLFILVLLSASQIVDMCDTVWRLHIVLHLLPEFRHLHIAG